MTTAFPLAWPAGWPRKAPADRKGARFNKKEWKAYTSTFAGPSAGRDVRRDLSVQDATGRVLYELQRLGVADGDAVISTNMPLRLDGLPRSDRAPPADPGVAVYWRRHQHAEMKVMAIDAYDSVAGNLAAIAATLEAMRAIERHGGAQILERAFTGFDALPPPRSWRQVLGLANGVATPDDVETAYRSLAKRLHPDAGGNVSAFEELSLAREAARRELGAG